MSYSKFERLLYVHSIIDICRVQNSIFPGKYGGASFGIFFGLGKNRNSTYNPVRMYVYFDF